MKTNTFLGETIGERSMLEGNSDWKALERRDDFRSMLLRRVCPMLSTQGLYDWKITHP